MEVTPFTTPRILVAPETPKLLLFVGEMSAKYWYAAVCVLMHYFKLG